MANPAEHPALAELGWVSELNKWALYWSQAEGWPVFPVVPGTKRPFAGSNGVADATTDPDRISRWWSEAPAASIGAACTGRLVLDVDDYRADHQPHSPELVPPTRTMGARGRHLVFRVSEPPAAWAHHLDGHASVQVKAGPGSFVVLPPSLHPSGVRYEVRDWRPEAVPPGALVRAATSSRASGERAAVPDPAEPRWATMLARRRESLLDLLSQDQDRLRNEHTWALLRQGVRCGCTDAELAWLYDNDRITVDRVAGVPNADGSWHPPGLRERELPVMLADPRLRA